MTSRFDERVEHTPQGNPCRICGKDFLLHRFRIKKRPEHIPNGDPCKVCGIKAELHRSRHIRPEHRPIGDPCKKCNLAAIFHRSVKRDPNRSRGETTFVGIDGEGQGRENHRYVLLAASDAEGKLESKVSAYSLSTVTCLDFILSFPESARLFAYAFNYDLTMMLKDLPNELLYFLFRPELRRRRRRSELGPMPIVWEGYTLNMQGTRFSVSKGEHQKTIWDIWKFYQCRFVKALEQWKIGEEERAYLDKMKAERGNFDKMSLEDITPYCLSECRNLATLAKKLVNAHEDAGLKLTSFYGAGSTGGAIMRQMDVKRCMAPNPEELERIIACSFFGGRFENSRIGLVPETVHSYDISSAYPYQLYFLPCLKHARWEHVTKRNQLVMMTNAIVRYRLHTPEKHRRVNWGPFPFRLDDGTICFPESSGGGWVWLDEFIAGEAMFPNVEFLEAWVLHNECDCHPFKKIPHYYLERLRIGKEGAGWVFKLGPNSVYGKLAQSVGNGPYTQWALASMVTSGCRGQLLQKAGSHRDLENILMLATDGIHTLEEVQSAVPKDTGTYHAAGSDGKLKPLGGWEYKKIEGGVFYARPGVYFPLATDTESVRGRGLGRATLYANRKNIMDAWEDSSKGPNEDGEYPSVRIGSVVRFLGAKSSISYGGGIYNRSLDYGQWRNRPIDLSFSPLPKRQSIQPDGKLALRSFPHTLESRPYKRAIPLDAIIPIIRRQEIEEQPDLTLGVYDDA